MTQKGSNFGIVQRGAGVQGWGVGEESKASAEIRGIIAVNKPPMNAMKYTGLSMFTEVQPPYNSHAWARTSSLKATAEDGKWTPSGLIQGSILSGER